MKRYDIWLTLVLGITLGLVAGIYVAGGFSSQPTSAETARKSESPSKIEPAPKVESGGNDERNWANWVKNYAANFEKSAANQPMPGLTEAMAEALNLEDGLPKMLLLIEMMRKEDFPVALEIMRKPKAAMNRGGVGPPMWAAFWQRFGERDPATALTKALEFGEFNYAERNRLEHHVFRGMARKDPRKAAEEFVAHPELLNRNNAAGGLLLEWVRKDPGAASTWGHQNLQGGALDHAFFDATMGVTDLVDIAGANAFAKTLPDGPARAGSLRSIREQIRNKPDVPAQQILDFVAINRDFGIRDRNFEAQMAAKCAEKDAMAAANYFSQPSPDGSENDFAGLKIVTAKWIQSDPKVAENWAKGQERTAHYAVVAGEFARAAQERGDQAEAQRWLNAIAAQTKAK